MFEREHHQRIAKVLQALDGERLRSLGCLFGGGTCIALRYGEYRESVAIDFLVSAPDGYRELRQVLTTPLGLDALLREGAPRLQVAREVRADQYGLRTSVLMDGQAIKLEIVREARIALQTPSREDQVCGIPSLTPLDLAASKLLANSDRRADDGVFSRDLIDLAMMGLRLGELRAAEEKASIAYGPAIMRDLASAIEAMQQRQAWLERCMRALAIRIPRAVVWQRIRALRRLLPPP